MPTTTTRYRCDVCGREFDALSLAVVCEEQGPALDYLPGTIFGRRPDRVFAVAESIRSAGHENWCTVYMAHDPPDPDYDVLPPRVCGHLGELPGRLGPDDAPPRNHPAVHRLAAALAGAGIVPHVWTGARSVPFDAWLSQESR